MIVQVAKGATAANLWMNALPENARAALLDAATPVEVEIRQTVHEAGEASPCIYFPVTAVFSMVISMSDGKTVEANMVGREGFVPVTTGALLYSETVKTIVQIGGEALCVDAKAFASLVKKHETIGALRERYLAAVYDVMMQSVGCNAVHSVRERCARWLLALSDRTDSHDINVIHQVLAETLGASRPRVTEILATLQNDGLLELQRATLRILDVEGLRGAACECYAIIKDLLVNFPARKML